MVQLNLERIHPLLRSPEAVSIASRKELQLAFAAYVDGLSEHFNTVSDVLRPAVPITVRYLSDNGGPFPDTARKEVRSYLHDSINMVSALSGIEAPTVIYDDTPAQSWAVSAFELAQIVRAGMIGVGNITFLNCAPRIDERGQEGNVSNKGEPIYIGIMPNGHVVTANSRYNLTYFKDMIENGSIEFFEANVQTDGTQFRSRDIFPTYEAILANVLTQNLADWKPNMSLEARRDLLGKLGFVDLDKKLEAEYVPTLPPFTLAHIDVHENVKLNVRLSELEDDVRAALESGDVYIAEFNGHELQVRFTKRMFDRADGEPGLSVGSSANEWIGADHSDGFLEISVIGGKAASALGINPFELKAPIQIHIPGITGLGEQEAVPTPKEPEPVTV